MINFIRVLKKNLQNLEAPKKTYATAQSRGRLDIIGLAKHMSSHNSPYSRGVIAGVLEDFVMCVRELILDGWIIDLGTLGTFNISLSSIGVCESEVDEDTGEKPVFTQANIKAVNCRFTPGPGLRNLIEDAQFHEVEARHTLSESLKKKAQAIEAGTWKKG